MADVYAVVVAAGRSTRMGAGVDKQLLPLAGRPVLWHTLRVFEEAAVVAGYVLVVPAGREDDYSRLVPGEWRFGKLAAVVAGGGQRQESVWRGLMAVPPDTAVVLVHDGARPLVAAADVKAVVNEARQWGAATLAVPVKDTVKEADQRGFVVRTPPREALWLTQTPQGFAYALLMQAHREAREKGFSATDDAALVEALGRPVRLVQGSYRNIKITTPGDLAVAEALFHGQAAAGREAERGGGF
ncbi:2-C-methyl-D-erythritol 4-phosphate cytidylyltransferase [Desulfotomaculum copahuensis]|uniref:2-C-methyl-D-erythritol 4-phosphate cytidylyltransferase n=1 Tax=Desulfotomaculum copahuensis TaxID=1838280 RepID=A0A1B7LGQ3_9FIRM|nr:2-C-methyl-D-erythritol 4-phosphate cytidylyltransferase [Desulfotomaculum copahuensis]OAT85189.1 2-C-methyl-D-erythritol 4-phosphate cytidylyltransferase [Desulfotomaculum copahuensis]